MGEEEKATSNKKKEEENLLIGEEQQQRRPVISSPHSGFPTGSTLSVNRLFLSSKYFFEPKSVDNVVTQETRQSFLLSLWQRIDQLRPA